MSRVYLTPLPDSQASTSDEGVRTQIQQSGLLQQGGTAVEKIAQDNIDLVVDGTFNFGRTFSKKVADELESLGESEYSGLPFFNPDLSSGGRNAGYYELERVDVSPSHPVNQDAFEYTAAFTFTGTKQTDWSAVETNIEDVQTGLATGSDALIGLPTTATKTKWFGTADGTESATASSTVTAEYGDVDLYDPADTSIVNPTLLYELDYADVGSVDVRVFDDRGVGKYYTVDGQDFSRWTHAYHTSYEFEGDPLVDNGRHRLRYDEPNGEVEFYEWDTGFDTWNEQTVDHSDFSLVDADFEQIGAADTRVYAEFEDDSTGSLYTVILSHQRGLNNPIARGPVGETWTTAFEDYLDQFCSDVSTDPKPTRTLKSRGEVK
jgi:hypothetical protein